MDIGGHPIGQGQPVFIIAEIGINHNGDVEIAKRLIDAAKASGADAVKFQKRTPELCVPQAQQNQPKETPWGTMTYLEYKRRVELDEDAYKEIDAYCKAVGMIWFASCWDVPSFYFIQKFNPPAYKIASASLTNEPLILAHDGEIPLLISTGMSTFDEIIEALELLWTDDIVLMHCRSTYPAALGELNLNMILTLAQRYGVPVGYSGHETGIATTVAAVALGACVIERHITLDRAMWGTDQAASLEPTGFARMVKDIRAVEQALGDGQQRDYASEAPLRLKLRGA